MNPYHMTKEFDAESLPNALRNAHNTKVGVWGLLRVLEGEVELIFHDPHRIVRVTPEAPAMISPQAVHHVEIVGPMRMRVEFYHEPPLTSDGGV